MTAPTRQRPFRPGRPERLALAASLGLIALGLWWRADPASYPFGPGDRFRDMSLISHLGTAAAADVALWSGAGSVLIAGALLRWRPSSRWLCGLFAVVAVVLAVTFGYVVPDIQLLIVTAYGLTLSLPALVTVVAVWKIMTRRAAITAAVLVFIGTLAALVLLAHPERWGGGAGSDAATPRPLIVLASLLVGVAWAAVAVRLLRHLRGRCPRCGRPGATWTLPSSARRWGRVVTWAAALTPLPYVLARLTWLTPWPYGESADVLARNPGLWVFGLGLAAAGEFGSWLVLGLIKPRGEAFPAWLPMIGGRAVPVAAAVMPGAAVALLMGIGGHSIVQQAFGPGSTVEDHLLVVLVPLPVWGLLLALSVLAYWYRRRGSCRSCRLSAPRSELHDLARPNVLAAESYDVRGVPGSLPLRS